MSGNLPFSNDGSWQFKGTVKSYLIGFIISVALTVLAFSVLLINLSFVAKVTIILVLAFAQLITQLYFFMHLMEEPKPRWSLYATRFAFVITLLIVLGSIWVMFIFKNHTMPTSMEMDSLQPAEHTMNSSAK